MNTKTTKPSISKKIDLAIHLLGYTLVLITISVIFKKTVYIDNALFGLWGLIAVIIIFILNRTVKPLLVWLTLPLTALTLGLFYPIINVLVLNKNPPVKELVRIFLLKYSLKSACMVKKGATAL